MPELDSLRERIAAALDASMDRCARCRTCDVQVDAVMALLAAERPDGTVTEWGVQFRDESGRLSAMAECGSGPEAERTARSVAGTSKRDSLASIFHCRQVGPWKEVPDA